LAHGEATPDPAKSPHLRVRKHQDGKPEVLEPYTDPKSWRAVAKVAFEVLAFIIQENIFKPVFDEWRDFVRYGQPDLAHPKSQPRRMRRGAVNPDSWKNRHLIMLDGGPDGSVVWVALYGSYEFFCFFAHPFPANEPRTILTLDLDEAKLKVWTQPDQDREPEFWCELPAP